jgi:son of sevenless-like protein
VSFWYWFIATAGYLFSSTGVSLTTLAFIQDRSKDTLPGNLVNFRKRQKASEVIQDIQRWQTFPHKFNPISSVQDYLQGSLAKFNKRAGVNDYFWNLSLEREPRESGDGGWLDSSKSVDL